MIAQKNIVGYHIQTQNKDHFLSTDFGIKEFNVKSPKERIRGYRRYVYEARALTRPDKMQAKVIDDKVVAKERKKDFEISRINRFRYRTRYFTNSGIIGSKEFVAENYQRFKHLFYSKHEKKPKRFIPMKLGQTNSSIREPNMGNTLHLAPIALSIFPV